MIDIGTVITSVVANLYGGPAIEFWRARFAQIDSALPRGLFNDILPYLKTISLGIIIVCVIGLLIVRAKSRALKKKNSPSAESESHTGGSYGSVPTESQPASKITSAPAGPMTARWQEVVRHMDSNVEAQWRFAVIEADKLVDDVLRRAGFPGATMGERLTNTQPGQLAAIDDLWEAHKLRNRLAHDIGYFLRYTEAKRAISQFETALKELSAL